jgi:hypothetical protein
VRGRLATGLAVALLLATPGVASADGSPWEWSGVDRVVAVGDVHGSLDKLTRLLRSVGLLDGNLSWVGGDDHLVLCGDLIDRGPDDRAVLDLVRRLQTEAAAAGGRVHLVLGNHEAMNLSRDLRYVHPQGFADFAADEKPADRRRAFNAYRSAVVGVTTGAAQAQSAFDRKYPRGFFGRLRQFAPDGDYGAWLLSLPAVVKINGVLFVHGGLTAEVAALGLDEINRRTTAGLRAFLEAAAVLEPEVAGAATFAELQAVAVDATKRKRGKPTRRREAAASLLAQLDDLPFSPGGPLWYRGTSLENERILRVPVDTVLQQLDARALVVAHTPTGSGMITSRFGDRVYRVDTGMAYGGEPFALTLEEDGALVFDPQDFGTSRALAERPQGDGWAAGHEELPDSQLEQFLAEGELAAVQNEQRGDRRFAILELERKMLHLRALFQFVEETPAADTPPEAWNPRRWQHEIAAYRLDRLLGLRMVPVVAAREVEGRPGAASIWLESAIDLVFIRRHGRGDLLQGLEPEIARARVFTALIGARERHDAGKMLLPPVRKVMLADNSKGFPLTLEVADLLRVDEPEIKFDACIGLPELEPALRMLTREKLTATLADLVSGAQIDAVLARRDRILETCAEPGRKP